MKIYFGLVDALGMESFIEYNKKSKQKAIKQFQMLKWRAQFNPQRNAVVYKIKLSKETIEFIKDLLDKGFVVEAGKIITKYLDKINGTQLAKTNEYLLKIHKLRGYL